MSKQTAVDWLMKEFYGELQYVPITRWNRVQDIFQRAKEMEEELLFEYWKGGQSSEEEGGLSFDVYHNGDDLVSTDMDAMHKQMKMEEEQIMDTMCQQLQIEVNVSETQEYYKSKEVQDLDKAIDLIDE